MRRRVEIQRLPGGYALKNGRRLVNFSDNDYLGLSFEPRLREAAEAALEEYGAGAGASRLVTGNHPLYTQLEQELAVYKGTEDALVFGSGFLANLGVITALVPPGATILADRLIHASLVDAMRLSGNKFQRFQHNDVAHLRALLEKNTGPAVIVTESIFSMDGDRAPLAEMLALAEEFDTPLIVDDAHGFGVGDYSLNGAVTAPNPTASPPHTCSVEGGAAVRKERIIWIGTFSKAAGSYGGYVCTSRVNVEKMVNHARSLIYTTGLPPAVVAANLAALRIIRDEPELTGLPLKNARRFDEMAQSAIVPVVIGGAAEAVQAAEKLEEEGFLVVAIRPPTVPEGTSRLRLTFSAVHQEEDIARLAAILTKDTL